MAKIKLHLANCNYLYDQDKKAIMYNGHPIYRCGNDKNRWFAGGIEVEDYEGKSLYDLEKIIWNVLLIKNKRLKVSYFCFLNLNMLK